MAVSCSHSLLRTPPAVLLAEIVFSAHPLPIRPLLAPFFVGGGRAPLGPVEGRGYRGGVELPAPPRAVIRRESGGWLNGPSESTGQSPEGRTYDGPRRAGDRAMPGAFREPPGRPLSVSPSPTAPANPPPAPPLPVNSCLNFLLPLWPSPCFSLSLCLSGTLLLYGLGGGTVSLKCPPEWGRFSGISGPPPHHGDSDGLCPFNRAGRQVLEPDSRVRRAFQVVGSPAKSVEVEMSVASDESRLLGEPRPGPPRLAIWEFPSGRKS